MDIRVLGPVEILVDGVGAPLGGPRQRALLALLVAATPRVVPVDRLIEGIWGEEPSAGARSTLQTYVSNLRQGLGDALKYENGGYRLAVEPELIDAARFVSLLEQSRTGVGTDAAETAARLRQALGLWRGRPYADLVDVPGLEEEVRWLEERRLEAVELRIDAELAAGRHGELVAELDALAEEHPTRERFRAQHMLALYRSGRQAEALRAFQRTESYLSEELGLNPSRELQDLELAILSQEDSLLDGIGRAVTQRLAFLVTDIEGSTRLWDRLPRAMAAALAAQDRIWRQAIETAGGRVFKHTGDGVLAALPDAGAAANAAESALREMSGADWGEVGELRVRVGIDLGEAEARGGDFYGPPVNRAARLCSLAHGGQVLISSTTQTELAASASVGLQVRQLGEYRLRGVATPERVSQLVFVGLPADFPDLRVDADPALDERASMVSLPGYEVRERIGQGAFGVVWRAYQPSVGREVAVKVIRPEFCSDPAFVRRFEAEARTVARLAHPHIVPLIDFWRDPDIAYLVLGLMPGGSLGSALAAGTIDQAMGRRVLAQIGAALDHAHSQGLSHGDVKPANVLLDAAGNAYLSDFGIAARLLDAQMVASVSSAPEFRAPEEQVTGPTPAADLYSLGAMAGVLLEGSPELDVVLSRATAPDPDDRYQTAVELVSAVDEVLDVDPTETIRPVVTRNPYKGLRAFDEGDAVDYHGRTELVAALVAAVGERRFVTVVGPSGSGKSSAVRAGLLPALTDGAITGSDSWYTTLLTPGPHPLDSLAEALEQISDQPVDATDFERVPLVLDMLRGDEDSEMVLVVDQLEELFTLVDDPAERDRFVELLVSAAEDERSRVRVVATLRADFYDKPLEEERLGRLVRDGLVTVLPPTRDELLEMITSPAQTVGLRWEPGLPHRITEDVVDQPGGLPLLQYALTELVERRTGDLITGDDYGRIGGVPGALATRAEATFGRLTPGQQRAARRAMLRLVTVGEDSDDTRRRVRRSELESLEIPRPDLEAVLDSFTAQRLFLADRDPLTRGPTVEVAHEAILREWPRLRGWIDDQREALILGRRFRAALSEWETNERHDDYLLTGNRLAPFSGWSETTSLTPEETTYYQASLEQDQSQRMARRRRRRTLTGILAVAAVLATTLGTIAAVQAGRAGREARTADARRLAGDSSHALPEDPELAILLALESAYISRDAGEPLVRETIAALQQSTQTSRLEFRLDGAFHRVAISPDGLLLATSSADESSPADVSGAVVIWSAVSRERIRTLPGEIGHVVADVAFSPDGSVLAVAYFEHIEEGTPGGHVGLFDPVTGAEVGRIGNSGVVRVAWSPDGRLLATPTARVVNAGRARAMQASVWESTTGEEVLRVENAGFGVVFVDEENLAITDLDGGSVVLYDVVSGEEVGELIGEPTTGDPESLSVDPERNLLLVGFTNTDLVELWDLETRMLLWSVSVPVSSIVQISPQTGAMVSGSAEGTVNFHDPDDGSVMATLTGHISPLYDLVFYPGGERLVSVSSDGETRVWDITPSGPVGAFATERGTELGATVGAFGMQFSPDREEAAVAVTGALERYDLETGEMIGHFEASISFFPGAYVSPDWRLVAYVDSAGEASVRDLATGDIVTRLPACTAPKTFSHDGSALVLDGVALCGADPPAGVEMRSRVIDVVTGDELFDLGPRNLGSGWPGAAFNPDGVFEQDRFLAVTVDGLEVYDLTSDEPVDLLASYYEDAEAAPQLTTLATSVAFDPTGRYLATVTFDGGALVFDLGQVANGIPASDAVVFAQVVDAGLMTSVDLDSNGVLATGSLTAVRLWDIHTDEHILDVPMDGGRAGFSPNGDYLYYVVQSDRGGLIWRRLPLDTDELITVAEKRVTRGLTDDECLRYLDPTECG
ncbi:MAG TPA: BTAD domain-containing putative transcriptional regulator [Acidimicrobiia bacterium]|nr:BTAD domain-containing putative transcriptional regulator [Acidimicrobiia bacterium]